MKRLIAICAVCCLLAGCAGPAAPSPTGAPVPPAQPAELLTEREFDLAAGESIATLRASAPGADWSRLGAEAPTVSLHLDGAYRADMVLFRGETSFGYEALLGPVTAGKHKLEVFLEPGKSAAGARQAKVEELSLRTYAADDPLHNVIAHAPIIYGRADANVTDTPLLAYHEVTRGVEGNTYQYTYIFSHEDGGTAPDGLMARWGRITDIEYVYRVTVAASGQVVGAVYQDKDHKDAPYTGPREGTHPVLSLVTRNNLLGPGVPTAYRFSLAPVQTLPEGSREEVMDRNPWTYLVMAQEWQRHAQQGTEKMANPQTREVSDPRNYLYIEFRSRPLSAPCDSKLAIQVKLRGADTVYNSDHMVDSLRIQSEGWRRAAVELPEGTGADQVVSLAFAAYAGKSQPGCSLLLTDLRKAFLLDQGYVPGTSVVSWKGEQILEPDATSGAPATYTILAGAR